MQDNESRAQLAVVIPCKDTTYLDATLSSLAVQDEPADEIVVVDSGAGSSLQPVLGRWREQLPLNLVGMPQLSVDSSAAARNRGVDASNSGLIVFVDADDTVNPSYLAAMRRGLQAAPLVCATIDRTRLNPDWFVARSTPHPQELGQLIVSELRYLPFAGAGTLGVRREVWNRLGGFVARLACYEEADFCWRAQELGLGAPHLLADAVLHYRLRTNERDVWHRAKAYGKAQAMLYSMHRDRGMRARTTVQAAAGWTRTLVEGVVALPLRGQRARAVWDLAVCAGRLSGSLQHRVRYL